jgi:hypothetical protein
VWARLPAPHRRWIILKALLVTAVLNVLINAAIAWLSIRGQETVPMWGLPLVETSIFWNVVGTLFLLPLITSVLVTISIRRDVKLGALTSVSYLRSDFPRLGRSHPTGPRRGVDFGAISVAAVAPILILVLVVAGSPELTRGQFIVYQTAFAVALGWFVTPVIALFAMAEPDDGG